MFDTKKAQELIESVFTFDNVGEAMLAVRRNLTLQSAQERLIRELVEQASRLLGDENCAENLAILNQAAVNRVQQFVAGAKSGSSGCGRRWG